MNRQHQYAQRGHTRRKRAVFIQPPRHAIDHAAHHQSTDKLLFGEHQPHGRRQQKRQAEIRPPAASWPRHRRHVSGGIGFWTSWLSRASASGANVDARYGRPNKHNTVPKATSANVPAVAHTSNKKLCGSRISSLACGQFVLRVKILKVSRAHAQPGTMRNHYQRRTPVFHPISQRLGGFGEHLNVQAFYCHRRQARALTRLRRSPTAVAYPTNAGATQDRTTDTTRLRRQRPHRRCGSWSAPGKRESPRRMPPVPAKRRPIGNREACNCFAVPSFSPGNMNWPKKTASAIIDHGARKPASELASAKVANGSVLCSRSSNCWRAGEPGGNHWPAAQQHFVGVLGIGRSRGRQSHEYLVKP